MKQTFKTFWAHRRQNAWIVVEMALVSVLSFYSLDYFVVAGYDTYLCRPDGDFEREHLVVGQVVTDTRHAATQDSDYVEKSLASLYALREQVRALPEVLHAGLCREAVSGWRSYRVSSYSSEADTARCCAACEGRFMPGEQYFETLGLTTVEGSPSAEVLSKECPAGGVVVSRSLAEALFGTAEVVGRRIVEWDWSDRSLQHSGGAEVVQRYTVAGVVEDFRMKPNERYAYSLLVPLSPAGGLTPRMLIRLRPEADAEAFVSRLNSRAAMLQSGSHVLAGLRTYADDYKQTVSGSDETALFTIIGTFIALLLLNVVLGTLGTFWLQIRKRTEHIGIMRSFGAKRRHVFWMLWREAMLITLTACVAGWAVWLQFALNIGLAEGFTMSGTGQEKNWVSTFWLHFLTVGAIQYVLLLAIVTLGMAVPTLIAMYKRPVEALQHE